MVTESNPGPTQIDGKSPRGQPKKIRVFKGAPTKCDLGEKITFNVVSGPKVQNVFLHAIQPVSLNKIKPWSVSCPDTIDSLQNDMQYEVNDAINSKMPLCQADITNINVDTMLNAANETLLG